MVQCVLAVAACIAYTACMQYTIRNVPEHLDAALRTAAREQGKSLNEIAVHALARGAGLQDVPLRKRDLTDLASTWREDAAFASALAAQDTIDDDLWPAAARGLRQPRPRKRARSEPPPAPARQKRTPSRSAA